MRRSLSSCVTVLPKCMHQQNRRCSTSYAAGIFRYKINSQEVFPYMGRKFETEENDNVSALLDGISDVSTTAITPELLKEWGAWGMQCPLEFGGLELSHTAHAAVFEELGKGGFVKEAVALCPHTAHATFMLKTNATKEMKGKYLPSVSEGSFVFTMATQEELCGEDINNIRSEAVVDADMNSMYIVNGEKLVSTIGISSVTHFLVAVKIDTQVNQDENGPQMKKRCAFLVVEKSSPGVTVDAVTGKMTLKDVKVSCENLVGSVGQGFQNLNVTNHTHNYEMSAALLGTLKSAVDTIASPEVNEGNKNATGAVRVALMNIYAMESMLYLVTANLDKPTEDSLIESALATLFVRKHVLSALTTLQEYYPADVMPSLQAARSILAASCDSLTLQSTVACCGIEDFGVIFRKSSTLETMQARTIRAVGVRDRLPLNNWDEAALVEKAVIKFGGAVESVFVKNYQRVRANQLLLERIADAAGLIYASAAVLSRAAQCAKMKLPTAKDERKLAALFVPTSMDTVNVLLNECINNGTTCDETHARVVIALADKCIPPVPKKEKVIEPPTKKEEVNTTASTPEPAVEAAPAAEEVKKA